MPKKSRQKFKYLENEKSFQDKIKAFFIIFEGLSLKQIIKIKIFLGRSESDLILQIFYFFFYIITFFKIIFIEINSSWVILELSKVLEIETSMLFSLDFASNTILSCFFFFFLIIDLLIFYFLIPAVITQIGNPTA